FYRAFGALGKKRGLKDRLTDLYLDRRGFDAKACALIAGFEGDEEEFELWRMHFGGLAQKKSGALEIGRSQGERWLEGRFHGPYLREPMMDRGIGVDTLETAASWSKIATLRTAVRNALDTAMRETAPRPGAR